MPQGIVDCAPRASVAIAIAVALVLRGDALVALRTTARERRANAVVSAAGRRAGALRLDAAPHHVAALADLSARAISVGATPSGAFAVVRRRRRGRAIRAGRRGAVVIRRAPGTGPIALRELSRPRHARRAGLRLPPSQAPVVVTKVEAGVAAVHRERRRVGTRRRATIASYVRCAVGCGVP